MNAHLKLVCPETGDSFPAEDGAIIGRDPASSIQLNSKTVSSRHARIRREGDALLIEDLNSTNGIQLGGRNITRVRLLHGQVFRLGERHLHVVDENLRDVGNLHRDPYDNPSFDVIDDPGDNHTVFRGGYELPPSWSKTDYEAIGTQATNNHEDHRLLIDLLAHHKISSADAQGALMLLAAGADNTIYLLPTTHAPTWALGSDRAQAVVIEADSVMPQHAIISAKEGAWHLERTASGGAIEVNARPLEQGRIFSGDLITLGEATFVFHVME